VLSRWRGGFAALIVTLLTGVLVVLDITDGAMRRWWAGHALTTSTVSGLLVLAITLLVIDQVVRLRQLNDRARAIAAQAAIIMTQARCSTRKPRPPYAEMNPPYRHTADHTYAKVRTEPPCRRLGCRRLRGAI
jgi:uncharacterized membrane protein YcjF (UPF0283 family)